LIVSSFVVSFFVVMASPKDPACCFATPATRTRPGPNPRARAHDIGVRWHLEPTDTHRRSRKSRFVNIFQLVIVFVLLLFQAFSSLPFTAPFHDTSCPFRSSVLMETRLHRT
jgi:hypothetical protein